MVQTCWVNFQCRGVLLIWIIIGQGPIALAVGAGGGCLDRTFFLSSITSLFFLPLSRRRPDILKYWLKGLLNPKQPTKKQLRALSHVCMGWSGGAMVLGKLPVPRRPTI